MIGATASTNELVILKAFIGIEVPVITITDSNGINVAVNSNDLIACAHEAHNVAKAINLNLIKAELLHLCLNAGNNLAFF